MWRQCWRSDNRFAVKLVKWYKCRAAFIVAVVSVQVDRLKAELMYERRTNEEQLSRFEDERRIWHEEKEKVYYL